MGGFSSKNLEGLKVFMGHLLRVHFLLYCFPTQKGEHSPKIAHEDFQPLLEGVAYQYRAGAIDSKHKITIGTGRNATIISTDS